VLVVGGAARTPGSVLLAGEAALRVGGGHLQLAVAESVAAAWPSRCRKPGSSASRRPPADPYAAAGPTGSPMPTRPMWCWSGQGWTMPRRPPTCCSPWCHD
jgi:hypothetical protein